MKMMLVLMGALLFLGCSVMAAESGAAMKKTKLRHVVAFKFKENVSQTQIDQIVKAFADLKHKISGIDSFEWGLNNSPENKNRGCTHVFTLTFHSEKDRDAYLVAPAHKDFGKLAGPALADVFVVDYWAQD